jgi:DNA-binding CsgD family transcriptional regulator
MTGTGGLVGRDEELAAVEGFLGRTEPQVRTLLIEGAAGIGKTTLWEAGIEAGRQSNHEVRTSRPGEAEANFSFAVLGDLLADLPDEVLAALPPPQREAIEVALLLRAAEGERSYANAVAVGFLSILRTLAEAQPVLIAIDDVQWTDRPSAGAIEYAARRLASTPVRFLFANRSGIALPFDLTRPEHAGHLRRVDLGPLSLGALGRVLTIRLGRTLPRPVVSRIYAESGGNPFFGLELAGALIRRGLTDLPADRLPMPAHLGELVRERLELLPGKTRDALGLAAALADPRLAVLEAAGATDDLDPAFRGGVLEMDGERVRFTHPLLAGAAYAALSPSRRREVHRRLAALASDPEERARHLALGADGPSEEIAEVLDEAAKLASARGAPAAAATLADLAAGATPAAALTDRARRQVDAAGYLFVAGETATARAMLEPLVETLPAGRERARALLCLGMTREDGLPLAASYFDRACAEADGDELLMATIHIRQADNAGVRGNFGAGLDYARAGLECAERTGHRETIALALAELAVHEQRSGSITPGLLDRAVEMQESIRDLPPGYRSARRARAIRSLAADNLDAARADLEDCYRRAVEQGDEFEEPIILMYLSQVENLAGDLPAAMRYTDQGVEAAEELGLPQTGDALGCARALVAAHLGRAEARSEAQAALRSAEAAGDGLGQIRARAVLGFLELSSGNPKAAVEFLRPLPQLTSTVSPSEFRFLANLIEALITIGDVAGAETLLVPFERGTGLRDTPWTRACSRRCRGLLRAVRGDLAGALAALGDALVEHEGLSMPFERARSLLAFGQVQRRAKQKGAARATLGEALAIFERMGTPLWADKARAELARIGGRGPAGNELTEAESRIAALVAEGKSNKEIAAALFVTVNTVEGHLSHAYAKLGVRSRGELVHRLRRAD